MQLKLDRCSITLEHEIEHFGLEGYPIRYNCGANNGPALALHWLLQIPIAQVEREELSFTLRFADGQLLVVHTELRPYESGQIVSTDDQFNFIVF